MEKLNRLDLIRACAKISEDTRNEIIKDMKTKGDPFEIWVTQQLESLTNAVIFRRNARMGTIPFTEYKNNEDACRKMTDTPDIIIQWNAKPKIALECGSRTQHYFNAYEPPKCECGDWKNNHISTPQSDLKAYIRRSEEIKLPYYIAIGKPNKLYAIVSLEEWVKHTFKDHNPYLRNHPHQSVICLKQTPHHTSLKEWIKRVNMPQKH